MLYHRYQGTVVDDEGNVVPNANIDVRLSIAGLPLAGLKLDRLGEDGLTNPFTADSEGYFFFYATDNIYQVRAYLGAPLTPTFEKIWPDVEIGVMAGYQPRIGVSGVKEFFWRIDGDGDDALDGESEEAAKAEFQALHDYVWANYELRGGLIVFKCIGAGATVNGPMLATSRGIVGAGSADDVRVWGSATEVYSYIANNADVVGIGNLLSGETKLTIGGFKFGTTGSFGNCIAVAGGAATVVFSTADYPVNFGPCVQSHWVGGHTCNLYPGGRYTVSGSAVVHGAGQSGATCAPHNIGIDFVGSANSLSFIGGVFNCESGATLHMGGMSNTNTAAVNTAYPMGIVTGGMIKNYPSPTTLFANGIISAYGSGSYHTTGLEPLPVAQGGTGATAAGGAALDGVSGFASTGLLVRTAAATYAFRTLTGPAVGITVSNGSGVSGNPTLALANDLAAFEALSSTGYPRRTGTDTWTQDAAGQLAATATNDDASSGKLGEYVSSNIASGSAVSLATATAKDVTTISLTAGDWDVEFISGFTGGGTTVVSYFMASISETANTLDQTNGRFISHSLPSETVFNNVPGGLVGYPGITVRKSLSATTTIRAVAQALFTTSTCGAFGLLRARRVR